MKKTQTLLLIACMIAIAGCTEPTPPTTAPGIATAPNELPSNSGTTIVAQPCPALFPEGMAVAIPYDLVSERTYTKGAGVYRRVTVEFLEGDAATALSAFETSMIEAGFKERSRSDGAEGQKIVDFKKKGFGLAQLVASSGPSTEIRNPAARGVVHIVYQASGEFDPAPPSFNAAESKPLPCRTQVPPSS